MSNPETAWSQEEDAELATRLQTIVLFKLLEPMPGRTLPAMRARALKIGIDRPREAKWKIDSLGWKAVRMYLPTGPKTSQEIATLSGLTIRTIEQAITEHRHLVHIADYRRENIAGSPTRVWAWGEGKDARRPRKKTSAEYDAARKIRRREKAKRLRKHPDEAMSVHAKIEIKKLDRQGLLVRRDPMVEAFYGRVGH